MTIPEAQLETWSKQGAVTQSKETYHALRNVLDDPKSPYYSRSFSIFLQGSYANDTNVYADSDVDIVICSSSSFYFDISNLSEAHKSIFHQEYPDGQYSWTQFRSEVITWLEQNYGYLVKCGNKAVFVKGSGSRRDADVLVSMEHRSFHSFPDAKQQQRVDGVVFWTKDGTKIINYPKQHSENCTGKHQATYGWFKPAIRILKNMRNRMVEDRLIQDGLAPSYFLEGLLYNVPNEKFGSSYQRTFTDCMNWLTRTDRTKFVCVNGLHLLFQDGSQVSWRADHCNQFLEAVVRFWNEWRT